MNSLSAFPIAAQNIPGLQLYSLPTPSGAKVSIMLDEPGWLESRRVRITHGMHCYAA